MKLIDIYHQFFRISGTDGVYYCVNADTDAELNVKTVHHVRTDTTELPYDYQTLPQLTLRGNDIDSVEIIHTGIGMPYTPVSKRVNILKTQTPDSMGYESHKALEKLQEAVGGDTTDFVCERLQWTKEQIKEYLFAEQVDSVALIIYNFEARKQSVIIGDQTGIGKGRVASSIIRYAVVHGLIPIYCTENTGLFSDNYRDLCDIGCSDLVPFIINSSTSGKTDASIKTLDENDKQITVYRPISNKKTKEQIYKAGKMPHGYDYILTTYSQLKNTYHKQKDGTVTQGEDVLKYTFLLRIAPKAIFIFDESHNISGSKIVTEDWWDPSSKSVLSGSVQFTCFNNLSKAAANAVFLSATFAKQPQNMIIYANRTCIADAGLQDSELVSAIAGGGEALQEVISANIVSEGQMIRRESIYKDIEVNYITLNAENSVEYGTPDLEKEHRGMCDYITDLLNQINYFEQTYVIPAIQELNHADNSNIKTEKTDNKLGVAHVPLFSKLFQIVNQLLFAIKAEAVAEHAIRRLGEGKKVVIAISSTMEAFIKSLEDDDTKGEEISCDFALVLNRALENTLKIVRNGEGDFHEKDTFSLDLLPPEGQDMYLEIRGNIQNAVSNICISPIDLIISRIENAVNPETGDGYIVTEVTGRSKKIQFSNPECTSGYIVPKKAVKRNEAFSEFQNNQSDVLIINTSGATGASAHATVKNTNLKPEEVKPRCMIIAQTELDIDKEVQKRGRVNRTGQIYLPTYDYLISAIPAEQRLMMMLQKKLKSLDANATSNQKQSTNIIDVLDFFNKYGDQVAYEYLEENPAINNKLNNPLGLNDDGNKSAKKNDDEEVKAGFVKKITGYVPLLTCDEQADFYDSISENYKKLVDNLKKKGEYDLEVESMDLDAELIGSLSVLQPSSAGQSCFSDAVYQGIYSCKVLRKPYTKDYVSMAIQKNTKGKNAQEIANSMANDFAAYYENMLQDDIKDINKDAEERKMTAKEIRIRKGGTQQDIEDDWMNIDAKAHDNILKKTATARITKSRSRFIRFFYAGRACIVDGDLNTRAICLGAEIGNKTKNKFALSNITITFAVASNTKEISFSLVDKNTNTLEAIMGLSSGLTDGADSRFLENWSEYIKDSTADKERRTIIVGNLLKGYKNAPEKSKLISFTTHDGEVLKGILTPKNSDSNNSAPIIAAKYSIEESREVIMDAVAKGNSKTFFLTRGMEMRINSYGVIVVCTNTDTFNKLKSVPAWQSISDGGRGFEVTTENGEKIWKMSVVSASKLLDLLEEYKFNVEFYPSEAQKYFGDRKSSLKQGNWTPLVTNPNNIPQEKPTPKLLLTEMKLLSNDGNSPLFGSDADADTNVSEFSLDKSEYDSKHINNLAPGKDIPYSVIENLNKEGMTIESIDHLSAQGFPVCKYKTQVTVHGNCPSLKSERIRGYKCLVVNQNQSLGIRWIGIDTDKKNRIGILTNKIAYVRKYVNNINSSFLYFKDSTGTVLRLVICRVAYNNNLMPYVPAKYVKVAEDIVKSVSENTRGLFFGYTHTITTKETFLRPAVYCVDIVILGIYEKNIEAFVRKVYNLTNTEYKDTLSKFDELQEEYKRKKEEEDKERKKKEAEYKNSLEKSLPDFKQEYDKYCATWTQQHPIPSGFVKCNPDDKPQKGDIIAFYSYPSNNLFEQKDIAKYVFEKAKFDNEAELVFKTFYSAFGKTCIRKCDENGNVDKTDYRSRGVEYPGPFQDHWFVKRKTTSKNKTAVPGPNIVTSADLQVVDYSDKAIVLTGDTKPLKDQIKALGGKFGSRFDTSKVPSGIGWLFPKTKIQAVQEFVAKHGKPSVPAISPLLLAELQLLKQHINGGGGLHGAPKNEKTLAGQDAYKWSSNIIYKNNKPFLTPGDCFVFKGHKLKGVWNKVFVFDSIEDKTGRCRYHSTGGKKDSFWPVSLDTIRKITAMGTEMKLLQCENKRIDR